MKPNAPTGLLLWMASVGHVILGMTTAGGYNNPPRWRTMAAFALLSLAPDADVVAFSFGIPYGNPFGHRGASHSLTVALCVGLLAACVAPLFGHSRRKLGLWVTLTVMSHGLLDACTDGGLGVALLWPFSAERYFFPWRPLPVAPIGARFWSSSGLRVAASEILWFSPLLAIMAWQHRPRRARS